MDIIQAVKEQFSHDGIPVVAQGDGATQFMSREFQVFAKEWEIDHTASSLYSSPSNRNAESTVKDAKWLLKKSPDPWMASLKWHNTPTVGMRSSSSQRLFLRRARGAVITSIAKL